MADQYHRPVLIDEALEGLALRVGGVYVDATVGGGGHARAVASRIGREGIVIGIDRDPDALAEARRTLDGTEALFVTANAPFDRIAAVVAAAGYSKIDGVLYDLGVSSHQLDDSARGFTFRDESSLLDMRMSQHEETPTAADLLNTLAVEELTRIFREYADEKWAARIASFIGAARNIAPFATAGQLVQTVKAAIPAAARPKGIHPATKVFQALRIAVNDEFGRLQRSLKIAVEILSSKGRMVVISYHSGEDRIVKQTLAELAGRCICPPQMPHCECGARMPSVELIVKKPIVPTTAEVSENPRARSAKLRIAAKL